MNIWENSKWQLYYATKPCRKGLRVHYEKGVEPEVKRAIRDCIKWLRSEYVFPKRVNLYVKSAERIKAQNGDRVCGTFFRPADRDAEPFIKIATGDYLNLLSEIGKDDALASILHTIFHELTHYFQWLNDLNLTYIGEERQATNYANCFLKQ